MEDNIIENLWELLLTLFIIILYEHFYINQKLAREDWTKTPVLENFGNPSPFPAKPDLPIRRARLGKKFLGVFRDSRKILRVFEGRYRGFSGFHHN